VRPLIAERWRLGQLPGARPAPACRDARGLRPIVPDGGIAGSGAVVDRKGPG
jgi:hypothetical protein